MAQSHTLSSGLPERHFRDWAKEVGKTGQAKRRKEVEENVVSIPVLWSSGRNYYGPRLYVISSAVSSFRARAGSAAVTA